MDDPKATHAPSTSHRILGETAECLQAIERTYSRDPVGAENVIHRVCTGNCRSRLNDRAISTVSQFSGRGGELFHPIVDSMSRDLKSVHLAWTKERDPVSRQTSVMNCSLVRS